MSPHFPHDEEAGGHSVTAGLALIGLGALGIAVAFLIQFLELDFKFIEVPALAISAGIFITIGAFMVRAGREDMR